MTSRIRVFLIFLIFLASAIGYLDRTNITVSGVAIMSELKIDRQELGFIFSALLLGYAAFQIPAGWLAGRFGPRLVLSIGILWWCALTIAITFVVPGTRHIFWWIMAIRFALGMGESVMYPSASQFISSWIPSHERGKANGFVFAGVGAGAGLTPPLVIWLAGNYGWRASFWFSAIAGLLAAGIWWMFSRDRPDQHPLVSQQELAHIRKGLLDKAVEPHSPAPWRAIFRNKDLWIISLAYFGFGYIAFIFLNWFFIYLAEAHGLSLRTSAGYAMIPPIAMTVCCIAGGIISDALTVAKSMYVGRCVFAATGFLLTAVFLIIGARTTAPLVATCALAAGAGMLYLTQSAFWAVISELGGHHAGIVAGFMNTLCQIAGAITASLTPAIAKKFGWEASFYVAAFFAVTSAIAWLFANPSNRIEPLERSASL
jgi:ACS family glucarate transporter-like MFS transporter